MQNVNKVFINFPLDDIISNKVNLKKNETREKSIIDAFKKNKIVNYLNTLVRSKSAAYVFVKSVIVNPQKNNYLYDLNLYKNENLLRQLEVNLDEISKVLSKEKIFFYSIPYAAQVKNGCSTNDGTEEILKKIFNKKDYSILFLKKDFCKIKKPINYYLKNDPVHLSKQGHEAVSLILKKYVN